MRAIGFARKEAAEIAVLPDPRPGLGEVVAMAGLDAERLTLAEARSLDHNIPEALAVLEAIGPAVAAVTTHKLPRDAAAAVMAGHEPGASLEIQIVQ